MIKNVNKNRPLESKIKKQRLHAMEPKKFEFSDSTAIVAKQKSSTSTKEI